MAHIKIKNLQKEVNIKKEDMKKAMGGSEYHSPTLDDPNALLDVIYHSKTSTA